MDKEVKQSNPPWREGKEDCDEDRGETKQMRRWKEEEKEYMEKVAKIKTTTAVDNPLWQ